MFGSPISPLLRFLGIFIALTALAASPLHAQIGGDSDTLFQLVGESSADRFGQGVSGGGDVNGDGVADIIVSAPFANNGTAYYLGAVYAYSGIDGSLLHRWYGDNYYDRLGESVSNAGDVNGDGFDDVIAGTPHAIRNSLDHAGYVNVYSGADGSLLYQWNGADSWEYLGISVSGAGDVNADGFDDLIVGATGANSTIMDNVGAALVYSGADGSLLYRFDGIERNDNFGSSVSKAGDVNGDGFDDLIFTGRDATSGGSSYSPSVFVYSGADGSRLHRFDGESYSDWFGSGVSGAGDVNQDGFDDLLIGARRNLVNGIRTGSAYVYSGADGSLLFQWNGEEYGGDFGDSVANAGDVNGDGIPDLLISAFSGNFTNSMSGKVYLYSGGDGSLLHLWQTTPNDDAFGISISGAGDIDGDGFSDVIVGASETGNAQGAAFVYNFNPFLYASTPTVSAAAGGVIQLHFDFPDDAGFDSYKLLISSSGTGPTFYGINIPLTLDNMLGRTFLGNYPVSVFSNLHGTLDAFGDASGSITLPAGMSPSLIGTTYHAAAIANPAGQLPEYSSVPLAITITL